MSKIAIITDTHFGIRNDIRIFYEHQKLFFENFFNYLNENNIKHIIHLGDLFDKRKLINFQTLEHTRRVFINPILENNMTLDLMLGNHDTFYKNTSDLNSPSILLDTKNNNINVYESPIIKRFGKCNIVYIPWINSNNISKAENILSDINETNIIAFGHLDIHGFDLGGGINQAGLSLSFFDSFQHVYSGHFHKRQSIENITYIGSPLEYTWIDYNTDKGFSVFDTEECKMEFIQNKVQIFKKIFYDDSTPATKENINQLDYSSFNNCFVKIIIINKNNPIGFDIMIDKLYQNNVYDISVVDDHHNLNLITSEFIEESGGKSTIEYMQEYVEQLETPYKNDISKLLLELYKESHNIEVE